MSEKYCFVMMPFHSALQEIYDEVLKPAVKESGLDCIRADEIQGQFNIHAEMINRIQHAHVIIADLTDLNANVFYELGVAHTLGNNALAVVQLGKGEKVEEVVPFDLRGMKIISYENTAAGGKQLGTQIKEAVKSVDDWSRKINNPVQQGLDPESRPVPRRELLALQTKVEVAERALSAAQEKLREIQSLETDLERLRRENAALAWAGQIVEQLVLSGGESQAGGNDPAEVLNRIRARVETQGEVTVAVTPSADEAPGAPPGKITFRRVKAGGRPDGQQS